MFEQFEFQILLALVIVVIIMMFDVRWGVLAKCAHKINEGFESFTEGAADSLDAATGPLPTIRNLAKTSERDITGFNLRADLYPELAVQTGSGLY